MSAPSSPPDPPPAERAPEAPLIDLVVRDATGRAWRIRVFRDVAELSRGYDLDTLPFTYDKDELAERIEVVHGWKPMVVLELEGEPPLSIALEGDAKRLVEWVGLPAPVELKKVMARHHPWWFIIAFSLFAAVYGGPWEVGASGGVVARPPKLLFLFFTAGYIGLDVIARLLPSRPVLWIEALTSLGTSLLLLLLAALHPPSRAWSGALGLLLLVTVCKRYPRLLMRFAALRDEGY